MLQAGDKVSRFIIDRPLGEGGMGVVYLARDENLGRKVAIKVVATGGDAEAFARVLREARVIAALDHPNAVIIHEGGEINGEPYIVMEYVPGQTLREFVNKPDVTIARKIRWLVDVARVLSTAHGSGIVHRDVKPENVMVRPDGRVKVLDFGIARRTGGPVDAAGSTAKALIPTVTAAGGFVGTPMYMAPEVVKGKPADGRSDQFSWGVLAYELLEGKPPWEAPDALAMIASIMSEPPKPMQNPNVPPEVREIVMRALSSAPANRYGSMNDVADLLEPFAESEPSTDKKSESSTKPKAPIAPKRKDTVAGGRYSTQDLGQAIALALERKAAADAAGGKYDFDDLKAAAEEVGIDEESLRDALSSLRPALPPLPDPWVAQRQRSKQKLQRHAAIWAAGSIFFFLINCVVPGPWFFFFPVLSWWVGLAIHAIVHYFPIDRTPQEKEIEEQIAELRHRRVIEKLAAKQEKKGGRKLRVADVPEKRRLTEDEIEALAEQEALEEAVVESRNRRRRK